MKINKSLGFILRLIASIIVLGITAFFTPGFSTSNLWTLVLSVIILTIVDFIIGTFTKLYYHPYIKFFIGFILSGITLYLVQYLSIGYILSIIPIILGALVYGLTDYILPSEELKNTK